MGSGGMRSRVRRIFLIFHNPMVRPVALGGFVLPKASMITVKATGKTCPACSRLHIPLGNVGDEPMGGWYGPQLAPTHPNKDRH